MNIEYEITIDDLVAYNIYYFTHDPQIKRRMRVRKIIYISFTVLSIFAAIFFLLFGSLAMAIYFFIFCLFCLFIVVYYLSSKHYMRKRIMKEVSKRFGQGRNDVVGKHELSITQETIKDSTEMDEHMIRWDVMEDVVETDQHLFIILHGLVEACIIPKRAFPDEVSFTKFKEEAIKYHQAAQEAQV